VPATSYANWFSYTTEEFISENREIRRAIDSSRRAFPQRRLRFVGDSGLDDKKIFEWIVSEAQAEFVIRASHLNRRVQVYNRHLDRWEAESLQELVRTVPFAATWQVTFKHAGKTRLAEVKIGWLHLRLLSPRRPTSSSSSSIIIISRRCGQWWLRSTTQRTRRRRCARWYC
jgi:hypothetical protein